VLDTEARLIAEGAPPRDLSEYSAWRREADPANLYLLSVYSSFLVGQYAGMGDALNIDAIQSVLDLVGVDHDDRIEATRRLVTLHRLVRDQQELRKGKP